MASSKMNAVPTRSSAGTSIEMMHSPLSSGIGQIGRGSGQIERVLDSAESDLDAVDDQRCFVVAVYVLEPDAKQADRLAERDLEELVTAVTVDVIRVLAVAPLRPLRSRCKL
jgi:hypothetical protein